MSLRSPVQIYSLVNLWLLSTDWLGYFKSAEVATQICCLILWQTLFSPSVSWAIRCIAILNRLRVHTDRLPSCVHLLGMQLTNGRDAADLCWHHCLGNLAPPCKWPQQYSIKPRKGPIAPVSTMQSETRTAPIKHHAWLSTGSHHLLRPCPLAI